MQSIHILYGRLAEFYLFFFFSKQHSRMDGPVQMLYRRTSPVRPFFPKQTSRMDWSSPSGYYVHGRQNGFQIKADSLSAQCSFDALEITNSPPPSQRRYQTHMALPRLSDRSLLRLLGNFCSIVRLCEQTVKRRG